MYSLPLKLIGQIGQSQERLPFLLLLFSVPRKQDLCNRVELLILFLCPITLFLVLYKD